MSDMFEPRAVPSLEDRRFQPPFSLDSMPPSGAAPVNTNQGRSFSGPFELREGTVARQFQQEIGELLQTVPNTQEAMDQINASLYIARTLDVDPGDVYRNFGPYTEAYLGKPEAPMSAWRSIRNEYEIGTYQVRVGEIGRQIHAALQSADLANMASQSTEVLREIVGEADANNHAALLQEAAHQDKKRLEELIQELEAVYANMPSPEEMSRSLPVAVLKAMANQIPFMAATEAAGMREGVTGMATGALAAGIAGQLGPQALLPEEILTVPMGAIAGYFIAKRAGRTIEAASLAMGFITAGAVMRAREAGVELNPTAVRAIAAAGGLGSGAIENLQIARFLGGNRALANIVDQQARRLLMREMTQQVIGNRVLDFVKRFGVNWGAEVAQEFVQESLEFASEELIVAVTNATEGTSIPYSTIQDYGALVKETIVQSTLAFGPMAIPGSIAETRAASRQQRDIRNSVNTIRQGPLSQTFDRMLNDGYFKTATDQEAEAMLTALQNATPITDKDITVASTGGAFTAEARGERVASIDVDTRGAVVRIEGVADLNANLEAPVMRQLIAKIQQENPGKPIVFDPFDDNAQAIQRAVESQHPDVAKIWDSIDYTREMVTDVDQVVLELQREIDEMQAVESEDVESGARVEELTERITETKKQYEALQARLERLDMARRQFSATDTRQDWQLTPEQLRARAEADAMLDNLDWSQLPRANGLRVQLDSAGFSAGEVEAALRLVEQRAKALGVTPERMLEQMPVRFQRGETETMRQETAARLERGERGVTAAFDPFVESQAVVWLTENATFRDVVHELAHYFRTTLTAEEQAKIEKHTGKFEVDGQMNREAEERWAWIVESFTANGVTEIAELRPILARAAEFIRKYFSSAAATMELSPEMRADVESMFASRPAQDMQTDYSGQQELWSTYRPEDYLNTDLFPAAIPEAPTAPIGSILFTTAEVRNAVMNAVELEGLPEVQGSDMKNAFKNVKQFIYTEVGILSGLIDPSTPWWQPAEGSSLIAYARKFFSPEGIEQLRQTFAGDAPPAWYEGYGLRNIISERDVDTWVASLTESVEMGVVLERLRGATDPILDKTAKDFVRGVSKAKVPHIEYAAGYKLTPSQIADFVAKLKEVDISIWAAVKKEVDAAARIDRGEVSERELIRIGGEILAGNRKTSEYSWDFGLATCFPTASCSVCYAGAAAAQVLGLSASRSRHAISTALYPEAVGRAVAALYRSKSKGELPVMRVNGAGDTTFEWQIRAVNEAIMNMDRPVHIFSRSHVSRVEGSAGLDQILNGWYKPEDPSNGVVVFKMGSIDKQLYLEYGVDFLRDNLEKRGIINSYLVGSVEDVAVVKSLREQGVFMILHIHTRADIVKALDDAGLLATTDNSKDAIVAPACPCALESGPFLNGCATCLVSQGPCFAWGSQLAMTPDGRIIPFTQIATGEYESDGTPLTPMSAIGVPDASGQEMFERQIIGKAYEMAAAEAGDKIGIARRNNSNIVLSNPRSREKIVSLRPTQEGIETARTIQRNWAQFAKDIVAVEDVREALRLDRETIDGIAAMDRAVATARGTDRAAAPDGTLPLRGTPLFMTEVWNGGDGNARATDSEAFRAWFGDSKIVNRDGTPREMYHATNESFEAFSNNVLGLNTETASAGLGHWFTDRAKEASDFAAYYEDEGSVVKAYLSLQNPYVMSTKRFEAFEFEEKSFSDAAALRARLIKKGHDGIIVSDYGWVAVFNPENIKSVDNRGTWDRNDARMLFSTALERFQQAGAEVDGRVVLSDVPNMSSIESSLNDYQILPGIREVPLSVFNLTGQSYSVAENNRIAALAQEIDASKEIAPLIVVLDGDQTGPYILEGAHRADALYRLGAKSMPAIVVVDMDTETGLRSVNDQVLFSTEQETDIRKAVERLDPVLDETLVQFEGQEWADAEIAKRREIHMMRNSFADLYTLARESGSVDEFVRRGQEMYSAAEGAEDFLRDIYHDVHVDGINEGNKQWAAGLTADQIIEIARTPEGAEALPLKMLVGRIDGGNEPTAKMIETARGYLRNNATDWRRRLAGDNDLELRRIQREQLKTSERGDTDTTTIEDAPRPSRAKLNDMMGAAAAFSNDPAFRAMIAGSMTSAEAADLIKKYDQVVRDVAATRERRNEAQAKQRVARQYREYMEKLGRIATRPLPKTIDAQYRNQIEDMQRQIDPAYRAQRTLDTKKKRQAWLDQNPEAREILSDRVLRQIESKSLNEWSQADLEQFVDEIQRLTKLGKTKARIRTELFNARVARIAREATAAVPDRDLIGRNILSRDASWWDAAKRKAREGWYQTLRPWDLADMVDGGQNYEGPMYKLLMRESNEATARELRNAAKREAAVHQQLEALGFKLSDMGTQKEYGGVRMMRQEAIGIYAINQNPDGRNYLLNGHGMTAAEISAIIADLSPQEMKVADIIMSDYDANRERLRDAHYRHANLWMDYVDKYVPFVTVGRDYQSHRQQLTEETLTRAGLKRAKPMDGMTKSRVHQLRNPARLRLDLYSTWHDQIRKQEHYIESADLVRVQDRVLSNRDLQAAVSRAFGPQMMKELRGVKDRFANPMAFRAYNPVESGFSTLRNNAAASYLAFNSVTAIKQVPSLAFYLADAGPGNLVSGVAQVTTDWKATRDFIFERDPLMANRGIDRAYEELQAVVAAGQVGKFKKGVVTVGMMPIQFMDAFATMAGWKAVYDKSIAAGMSEQQAITRAREVTQRTQPESRAYASSSLQTNQAMKWFTQFTNQLTTIWSGLSYQVPTDMKNGRVTHAMVQIAGVAMSMYIMWMLSARKPLPEEPEDIFDLVVNGILPILPVIGSPIASGLNGFSNESTVMTPFSAAGRALGAVKKVAVEGRDLSPKQMERLGWEIYEGVAIANGIPYTSVKRGVEGFQLFMEGASWPSVLQQVLTGGQWKMGGE
jgi:hypothetical protein